MRYLLTLLIFVFGCGPEWDTNAAQPAPAPIVIVEPAWTHYAPVRSVQTRGLVLDDIDSHLPAGNVYTRESDPVTACHEGTHGVNSDLRQAYHKAGFYVLNDRAVLIDNPAITLTAVAREIPASLRGFCYNLYFVQQLRDWNDTPTYPFDEWTAYTNGAEARLRQNIPNRNDTVQFCLEFVPYSICVAKAAHDAGLPEDPQMKAFIRWQAERCIRLGSETKVSLPNMAAADAADVRDFCRLYFGADWTLKNLGF